jgi:hypothetical protein
MGPSIPMARLLKGRAAFPKHLISKWHHAALLLMHQRALARGEYNRAQVRHSCNPVPWSDLSVISPPAPSIVSSRVVFLLGGSRAHHTAHAGACRANGGHACAKRASEPTSRGGTSTRRAAYQDGRSRACYSTVETPQGLTLNTSSHSSPTPARLPPPMIPSFPPSLLPSFPSFLDLIFL